jgi:hypothetical protein
VSTVIIGRLGGPFSSVLAALTVSWRSLEKPGWTDSVIILSLEVNMTAV